MFCHTKNKHKLRRDIDFLVIYDIINKAIKVYVHDSPDKAYCSWYYDNYGDDGISNLDNYSTISYAEASYICHNCSKCKIWEIAR